MSNPTSTTTTTKKGYTNGSDVLFYIGDKAIGHCTSHTVKYNSETKKRAVKAPASESISTSLWQGSTVTGLSYNIDFDGLRFYNETECGFKDLFKLWKAGKPVKVKCMERESTTPYLVGYCVISNLEESNSAQDDATYKGSLENDGAPETLDEDAITEIPATTE